MKLPYMKLWLGDFIANTMHLSRGEIGSYILLLAHHWEYGSLPADVRVLQRIARCTQNGQWSKVWNNLKGFFKPLQGDPTRVVSERVLLELSKASKKSNNARDAAMQMHSKRKASALHPQRTSESESELERKKEKNAAANAAVDRPDDSEEPPANNVTAFPGGTSPEGVAARYAFEQGVIRLSAQDLAAWEKAYPEISVPAELYDLASWNKLDKQNWFFIVQKSLRKRNIAAKKQRLADEREDIEDQERQRSPIW